jgi:hypothetical protein
MHCFHWGVSGYIVLQVRQFKKTDMVSLVFICFELKMTRFSLTDKRTREIARGQPSASGLNTFLCLSSSSALHFLPIILFESTTLLTGMTGISLHIAWQFPQSEQFFLVPDQTPYQSNSASDVSILFYIFLLFKTAVLRNIYNCSIVSPWL